VKEELFMRKPDEQGVRTWSYMIEEVGHDVVNWASASGDLTTQNMAIEYIEIGYGSVK
jgi:hypothetical protein